MSLVRSCFYIFSVSLCIFPCAQSHGETVSDILDWPPVFERLIGDPDVSAKEKANSRVKVQWIRPLKKVIVYSPELCDRRIKYQLIDYFLEKVWQEYLSPSVQTSAERKYDMKELIPMSRADYYRIGRIHLAGKKTDCAVENAWWKVRMGCPLTESKDYLLSFNNLSWAEKDGLAHGHYCFALRKRGGDPDGDMIFDFRAPWTLDRRTAAKDMFDESITLQSYHENYYDWLATQTTVRHCDIFATFVPVSEEQVILLKAYKGGVHKASRYRLFKSNCASLGLQFTNRLLPLDERIPGENSILDFPARKISVATGNFGETVADIGIDSTTLEKRSEFTHKNKTLRARPSRRKCESFLLLKQVAAIN